MKVYVWQQIGQVSNRHHEEGGLLIVAYSRTHAERLIADENQRPEVQIVGD